MDAKPQEAVSAVDPELMLASLISRVKHAVAAMDQATLDYFAAAHPDTMDRVEENANLDYAIALLISATRDLMRTRPALCAHAEAQAPGAVIAAIESLRVELTNSFRDDWSLRVFAEGKPLAQDHFRGRTTRRE